MTRTALVCGAGGFIGSHMVRRLKNEGYWVRGVDTKRPEYSDTAADEFIVGNLTDQKFVERVIRFSGEQGNFYHQTPENFHCHSLRVAIRPCGPFFGPIS